MKRSLIGALALLAHSAYAQIGLPNLRLPVPLSVQLPGERLLTAPVDQPDVRALENIRKDRIRDLLRRNRATLESDPNGDAIVRNEILLYAPSDSDLEAALQADFTVARVESLDGLEVRVVVLHAPAATPARRAMARLRTLMPSATLDFNHVYLESGEPVESAIEPASPQSSPSYPASASDLHGKLGLIDGGIDAAHPAFKDSVIHTHGCEPRAVPDPHGTAVASLMIGRSGSFHGAVPGMELFAADVYCGLSTGGSTDRVVQALAWLVRERVPVINMSLVGPPNAALEAVVRTVIARGYLIIAAVGNDGPSAPPLYPASYPGVIGVTAVDSRRHVLLEAARGPQVKFCAPGADIAAAKSPDIYQLVRGTSFAAPLVAGLLASSVSEPDKEASARALAELARRAIDLGTPGPDPIYGFGLVGADLGPSAALASTRAR